MTSTKISQVGAFAALAIVVLTSCFSPNYPAGVLCSEDRECPSSQDCAANNRCYDSDAKLNDDSALAAIDVSVGVLEPAFDPAILEYSLAVGFGIENVTLTPMARAEDDVLIVINETEAFSGAELALALDFGDSELVITVTSASGATSEYKVMISRGAGVLHEAYLKASNTDAGDGFGGSVAISRDGNTLLVGAPSEQSAAMGVDFNQSNNRLFPDRE